MSELTAIAIQQVSWKAQSSLLSSIRRRVFMEEQGVPESEEWDGLDDSARHFLALAPSGEAIGTARLVIEGINEDRHATAYHIGRVAVLPSWRYQGVGSSLMQAALRWCRQDALPLGATVQLNAQVDRLSFYQRLGFIAEGEVFMDAGIPHKAMFFGA